MFALQRGVAGGRSTPRLVLILLVFFFSIVVTPSAAQSPLPPFLAVTPSTLTVLAGEPATFAVVDESGTPLANVQWSIAPPIAEVHVENGKLGFLTREPGRAVVTATVGDNSATASLTVLPSQSFSQGTVRWSVLPIPGFQTLEALPGEPGSSDAGVAYYSIEWSRSENALLRAFDDFGQQVWLIRLDSNASPETLHHTLVPSGEVYLNQQLVGEHSQFILGGENAFAANNPSDPSAYGLPPDGKFILLRISGDNSSGIILLERGRFRDSLVDISSNGKEVWRFRSEGRLAKDWTVNYQGDIAIVETKSSPSSSALLLLEASTGQIRSKIPFPLSSSTVNGFRCTDTRHNVLSSIRPSLAGSIFTNLDGNIYIQVGTHVESTDVENCKTKQYSFDDKIALLRVTPDGQTEWKNFQHIHADGSGPLPAQSRIFAGESIPDGSGGVLAAWTIVYPDTKAGQPIHSESRLSRITAESQRDFVLPLMFWTPGITTLFDENMILGEGNPLYATNGPLLIRYDTEAGELNWQRHPPTGSVRLQHSTAGGGVLVSNAGRLVYFDAAGNGVPLAWTVSIPGTEDIGVVQSDPLDHTPLPPLALRELDVDSYGNFLAVEDGAPVGRGSLVCLSAGH